MDGIFLFHIFQTQLLDESITKKNLLDERKRLLIIWSYWVASNELFNLFI